MKEIENYLNRSYIKQKNRIIEEITQYFNYNYPNVKVSYSDGEFKIYGTDTEMVEMCKQDIENLMNFTKK